MPTTDLTLRLCPGGCGCTLRACCDSAIGDDHQSSCEAARGSHVRTWREAATEDWEAFERDPFGDAQRAELTTRIEAR